MLRFAEIWKNGVTIAKQPNNDRVSLDELMMSTLAMTDATAKLLIKKRIFTEEEFEA